MSRRATTPEIRGKRRLSFNDEPGKRSRPDDVRGRRDSAQGSPTKSSKEYEESPTRPGFASGGSSSSASSEEGDLSRTSRTVPTTGRPTWQTQPPPSHSGRHWQSERRDVREQDDFRDSHRQEPPRPTRSVSDQHIHRPPTFVTTPPLAQPPLKTQAAFVGKLYSMLEDDKIAKSGLLHWSQDGNTFVCPNPTEFSKEVLPNFFKHNNWQSFVRQLNMYSFNKVSDLYSTANSDPQAWEFRHPLFQRGHPELLIKIRRKSTRTGQDRQGTPSLEEDSKPSTVAAGPSPLSQSGSTYRFASPTREYPARPFYPPRPRSSGYESQVSQSPMPVAQPPHPRPPPLPHMNTYPSDAHSRSEPTYVPSAARPSPLDPATLHAQVAQLQETVHRLWSTLNTERYENARNNLDLTSHLLRVTDWMYDAGKELRVAPEILQRLRADLMQRYENLQASEMLSSVALGLQDDRRMPSYERARSIQSLHDRQVHSSHSHFSPPAVHERVRPATSDPAVPYTEAPRAYHSPVPRPSSYVDFRYRPPGMDARDVPRHERERHERERHERERPPRADAHEELRALDEAPKASLRNLLH